MKPQSRRRARLTQNGITFEQEAYCRGRAMGMSVEEAILAAGGVVTAKTARGWERGERVGARIEELAGIAQKNAILKSGLDREWVISRLMHVAERCLQEEPVIDKKTGEPSGVYVFDSKGANTALRALGDVLGIFRQQEQKHDDFAQLSDDDLARIAGELAAQAGLFTLAERTEKAAGHEQAGALQPLPKAT
jgi:hypothetical protein